MILRCQWIQEWIHTKSASLIMGVDSGGVDGLSVEDKDSSSLLLLEAKEEEEEELALLGGNNGVDFVEVDGGAEVVGAGAGDVAISRGETPVVGDGVGVLVDGGRGYKEVVPHIPPFITQQSASELVVGLARLQPTPQPQQMFTTHPPLAPQQLAPHLLQMVQSHVGQPAQGQLGQQTTVAKAKKARKSVEPSLSSKKRKKSSLSEKRGSIVKSIDKLASSITTDEANSAAMASASSGMMPMMLMMLMMQQQQQQHQQQIVQQEQQYQQQMQQQQMMQQQAFMQSQMELQLKAMQDRLFRNLKKDVKKRKKRAKKKRKAADVGGGDAKESSSSSSSSSSSESS
jgi:hypothetical protein